MSYHTDEFYALDLNLPWVTVNEQLIGLQQLRVVLALISTRCASIPTIELGFCELHCNSASQFSDTRRQAYQEHFPARELDTCDPLFFGREVITKWECSAGANDRLELETQ